MALKKCRFCGLDIEWGQVRGVWTPLDPDFGDHRLSCAGATNITKSVIRDRNHEAMVKEFLRKRK